jgi:hypothetical protein
VIRDNFEGTLLEVTDLSTIFRTPAEVGQILEVAEATIRQWL